MDEGDGKQGWLLLRASLHDPLLVLNAESDIPEGAYITLPRTHGVYASACIMDRVSDVGSGSTQTGNSETFQELNEY